MSYQPAPAPAPGYYPPQQPPTKRKKWPFIVGGLVLVMILGCVGVFALIGAGANEVAKGIEEVDQNQKGANAAAGKMNTAVKDGKFQFTVTGTDCGATKVGDEFLSEKAQGQFCLVDVTVKNVGKTAEMFDSNSQKAYDAKGIQYSVDPGAEIYVNDQNQTFLENINPGNQVKGRLVFDVPKGTKLTSIVLHESFGTAGIKVPLS